MVKSNKEYEKYFFIIEKEDSLIIVKLLEIKYFKFNVIWFIFLVLGIVCNIWFVIRKVGGIYIII